MKIVTISDFEELYDKAGTTEQERMETLYGHKTSQCSCNTCATMCKRAVCIGTPSDILRIINNGFIHYLSPTNFSAGLKYGFPEIPMVQISYDRSRGRCSLFNELSLCSLHDIGIKPLEGKLANCKITEVGPDNFPPWMLVAISWISKENYKTMNLILKAMEKYSGKI